MLFFVCLAEFLPRKKQTVLSLSHTNQTRDLKPFLKVSTFFSNQKFTKGLCWVQIFVSLSVQLAGRICCIIASSKSRNKYWHKSKQHRLVIIAVIDCLNWFRCWSSVSGYSVDGVAGVRQFKGKYLKITWLLFAELYILLNVLDFLFECSIQIG